MQLKHITIAVQVKIPGLWLKIRACLLGKHRREHENRIMGHRRRLPVAPGPNDS
jgi:hypothetical protein